MPRSGQVVEDGHGFLLKLVGEQAVALVHDQLKTVRKVAGACANKIQQPSRCCDQNTRGAAGLDEFCCLFVPVCSAKKADKRQVDGFGIGRLLVFACITHAGSENLGGLQYKFTRRDHNQQRARFARLEQPVQHGKCISCGFARAGWGRCQNIPPIQRSGNGGQLDGGRFYHACLLCVGAKGWGQTRLLKASGHTVAFLVVCNAYKVPCF